MSVQNKLQESLNPNSAKISASVAKELENRKDISYCFAATNPSVLDVVGYLNNKLFIKDVLKPKDWINIAYKQFRVSRLARVVVKKIKSGLFKDLTEFGALIDPKVSFSIAKSLRRAIEMTTNNDVLIKLIQPEVVASTNMSNSFSRTLASVGNQQGVSTFHIQHGFPAFDKYENYMIQRNLLVWGKKDREQWLKRGYKPDNVIITGSPKFEGMNVSAPDQNCISSHKGKLKITFFPSSSAGSTISEEMSIRALELVLNTVRHKDNTLLTIKAKSSDKFSIIDNYDLSDYVEVIKCRDAIDVIQESDIVIVTTSNVGLETCIVGKPLIVLNLPGLELFSFYEEYGCALFAFTGKELQDAIDKIVSDENTLLQLEKGRRLLIENVFNNCAPGVLKRITDTLIRDLRR